MVKIKFTKFGANSAFGGFAPGDVMRCSQSMADHLVNEVGVAKHVVAPVVASEVQPEPQPEKPAKAVKGKK